MVLLNDVGNISRRKGKIFWINNFYKHPLFEKCIFTTTTCALIHILDCETIFPFGITKLHWSSLQQAGPHGVVKCHTRSRVRKPYLGGITGLPNMCKHIVSSVLRMWSRIRSDTYRECSKMQFAAG